DLLGAGVRGITVSATNSSTPTATSYSVQAGGGAALSGSVAVVKFTGTTRAASGAHGPIGVGGYTVSAIGNHDGVNAKTLNITAGALAIGVTVAIAKDERNTEAEITGGSTSVGGAVTVTATASNTAFAWAPAAS